MNCSKCSGNQFKKLSLIFQEGTSSVRGAAVSTNGNISMGGGVITSELARRCAPPKLVKSQIGTKKGMFVGVIWFVGMLIGFDTLQNKWNTSLFWSSWAILGIAYIGFDIVNLGMQNKRKHYEEIADYDKQFMCIRCGEFTKEISEDHQGN